MAERFAKQKKDALEGLSEARERGEVDGGVLSIIDYVNSLSDYYTTSSCSGRICLLHDVGNKFDDDWIGKWHRKVSYEEVMEAFEKRPRSGRIRFVFEAAIFHIVAKDLDGANRVVTVARNSGFKKVGIISSNEDRNTVEVCSSERIDAPIADEGMALVSDEYVRYLVSFGNVRFEEGARRLRRLEEGFRTRLF